MKTDIKRIIFINFCVFFVLFLILEICSFFYLYTKYHDEYDRNIGLFKNFSYHLTKNPTIERLEKNLRPVEYRDITKRPIILFGCSFAYGHDLDKNETFSYKLADYSNRTVINRARQGEGPAFMYYQLSNKNIIKSIKDLISPPHTHLNNINKDVEYVIYVNITGHPIRNFEYRYNFSDNIFRIKYKIKDNQFIENKVLFPFLHSFHTSQLIEKCIENYYYKNPEFIDSVYEKTMIESINLAFKEFPNSKFVILLIPDGKDDAKNYEEFKTLNYKRIDYIMKKVNSDNLIVIDVQKYISLKDSVKYWLPNDNHPSAQAWEEIVPIIIKNLHIN